MVNYFGQQIPVYLEEVLGSHSDARKRGFIQSHQALCYISIQSVQVKALICSERSS